jgi:Flp pilus assembly protein TadD
MARRGPGSRSLAPLALGAALAGHAAAEARTEDPAKYRMTGPDPIAGASAEAARAQGRMLLQANNVTQALQAYRRALAQDPDSIEALNGIAVCYDRLGRFEDARLHYETALGIDPTSAMLLNNYGLSLALQGDASGAERFLRMAASAGDPDVQAAALRTLARIEREGRAAPRAADTQLAVARPAPAGPAIVRTSGHEQRLVLAPQTSMAPVGMASVRMAAALPPERALLATALGALSADEDASIAAVEQLALAREQAQQARAEAEREARQLLADARAQVPADMQVAALLKAARAAATARDSSPATDNAWQVPAETRMVPSPSDTDWHRDQILVAMPGSGSAARRSDDRAAMRMALLSAGFAPPRPAQRDALVAAALAALGNSGPRRSFEQAFESDNDRLNDFAARVQAAQTNEDSGEEPTVAEKVARLEALIARVQAA